MESAPGRGIVEPLSRVSGNEAYNIIITEQKAQEMTNKTIIVDYMDDFIDDKDYLGPDKAASEVIVDLEQFILALLRGQEEITITFKREDA